MWLKGVKARLAAMDLRRGDAFWVTGPPNWRGGPSWWPGKRGRWQPRAWSGHPDDAASVRIYPDVAWVDFGQRFVAREVVHTERFVTARVQVGVSGVLDVWINVAKDGVEWVRTRGCRWSWR